MLVSGDVLDEDAIQDIARRLRYKFSLPEPTIKNKLTVLEDLKLFSKWGLSWKMRETIKADLLKHHLDIFGPTNQVRTLFTDFSLAAKYETRPLSPESEIIVRYCTNIKVINY